MPILDFSLFSYPNHVGFLHVKFGQVHCFMKTMMQNFGHLGLVCPFRFISPIISVIVSQLIDKHNDDHFIVELHIHMVINVNRRIYCVSSSSFSCFFFLVDNIAFSICCPRALQHNGLLSESLRERTHEFKEITVFSYANKQIKKLYTCIRRLHH